jgi:hypothetical protein
MRAVEGSIEYLWAASYCQTEAGLPRVAVIHRTAARSASVMASDRR